MRFDSKYRPDAVVSKDRDLLPLSQVELDVPGKRMLATDGRMLAIVPCEPSDDDVSGPIRPAAFKLARRVCQAGEYRATIEAKSGACVVGDDPVVSYKRSALGVCPFPANAAKVVPAFKPFDPGTVTFLVNPQFLAMVASAIGVGNRVGEAVRVTVRIPEPHAAMLDPILLTNTDDSGAVGVLMPCRDLHVPKRKR